MTLQQLGLFPPVTLVPLPRARHADPSTSAQAAASMRTVAGAHERIILDALTQAGAPLSAEQIADRSGDLTALQVARRIAGLLRAGAISVGQDLVPTTSGRMARTYRVAETAGGRP